MNQFASVPPVGTWDLVILILWAVAAASVIAALILGKLRSRRMKLIRGFEMKPTTGIPARADTKEDDHHG